MTMSAIHIGQVAGNGWQVNGGNRGTRHFRIREHALAFGRALAFSTQSELLLSESDGSTVRQTRASMTYPRDLS